MTKIIRTSRCPTFPSFPRFPSFPSFLRFPRFPSFPSFPSFPRFPSFVPGPRARYKSRTSRKSGKTRTLFYITFFLPFCTFFRPIFGNFLEKNFVRVFLVFLGFRVLYLALGPGTKVGYLGNLGKVGDVRVFLDFLDVRVLYLAINHPVFIGRHPLGVFSNQIT